MSNYAEVAIPTPIQSTFTYHIPPALAGQIRVGHLVRVPFGTAMQAGIVVALHAETALPQTKPIDARLDPEPILTPDQIAFSQWISAQDHAPIGMCLWLWLPSGLVGYQDTLWALEEAAPRVDLSALQMQIIALLERRGALRFRQIKQVIGDEALEKALKALRDADILTATPVLTPPTVRPQSVQTVALAIHPASIPSTYRHLGRKSTRADLLEAVAFFTRNTPSVAVADVLAATGSTLATLKKLEAEDQLVALTADDHVRLAIAPDAVDEALLRLRKAEVDVHILQVLAREDGAVDVSWMYAQTGAKVADLKRLAALEFVLLGEKQTWRDSLAERDFVPISPPRLTSEQADVATQIDARAGAYLLHGVTGSGKTEIYLHAIESALARGRQAIFLVPEIALTAQTIRRVAARFPGKVALIHSRLSQGEQYDTWRRCREGLVQVVVGTRSAFFAPLPDVGCVCIDEAHDDSYKNIAAPHYDTRDLAEALMQRQNGTVILGTATPDILQFYRAQTPDDPLHYLHLPDRIMGHRVRITLQSEREGLTPRYHAEGETSATDDALTIGLPPVQLVDMREELHAGNLSMFSRPLHEALHATLQRQEQAILLLNRRGAATYVFCRDCGHSEHCPRCDTPLTYHQFSATLRCHHCGYEGQPPAICPECGSNRIRFFGAGTQQVEAEVEKLFPQARIVRWDSDTASRPEMHDAILGRFLNHQADVMVGTQLVAKGLDLPRVTLVGVISADTALNLPDYRAGERTFQLLTQVAGRAGRGLLGGQVILQTYQPDNYAIRAAASHDYAGFYAQELTYRREMGYPPFRRLARVLFQHQREANARENAHRVAALLAEKIEALGLTGTEVIGPAPCFFSRLNEQYRWHLLVRSPDPTPLLKALDHTQGWYLELDPVNLL